MPDKAPQPNPSSYAAASSSKQDFPGKLSTSTSGYENISPDNNLADAFYDAISESDITKC